MSYPRSTLRQFLHLRSHSGPIDDAADYKRVRVQLHGKGLVLRDKVPGREIKTKRQQVVRGGDFLVAEIDAKVGGFGIVPPELDGAIVSSHYFVFEIDDTACLREWIDAYVRSGGLEEQVAARGSTNYAAIRPQQVLDFEIPLPPVAEQRRVVTRAAALARRASEVAALRHEVDAGLERILYIAAHRPDLLEQEKLKAGWRWRTLGELLLRSSDAHAVRPEGTYPNFGILSFGRGLFAKPPLAGFETRYSVLYRVRAGQFIYSRLFAFEGAYAHVTPEFDGWYVSQEFPYFDCDPSSLTAQYLYAYFTHPDVWSLLSSGSKGLGDRRQRLHPETLMSHRLLLPPIDHQSRVAKIVEKIGASEKSRRESAEGIKAVVPSILTRAFRGEL